LIKNILYKIGRENTKNMGTKKGWGIIFWLLAISYWLLAIGFWLLANG
jgi:hypothetical protein